eukprot:TRINITY_DN3062_c0_g2_i9.p1 TRINITY_DN3062_c0_g2~~TRINITY_DN3062_c0_g2_i9.p1  ORF type:complete len:377 (+),score=71.89 TRINITY_DN3062_c0_g2_i9:911-2041(+)
MNAKQLNEKAQKMREQRKENEIAMMEEQEKRITDLEEKMSKVEELRKSRMELRSRQLLSRGMDVRPLSRMVTKEDEDREIEDEFHRFEIMDMRTKELKTAKEEEMKRSYQRRWKSFERTRQKALTLKEEEQFLRESQFIEKTSEKLRKMDKYFTKNRKEFIEKRHEDEERKKKLHEENLQQVKQLEAKRKRKLKEKEKEKEELIESMQHDRERLRQEKEEEFQSRLARTHSQLKMLSDKKRLELEIRRQREIKQYEDYNTLKNEYYKVYDLKKEKVLKAGSLREDLASDVEYVMHHNKDPFTAIKRVIARDGTPLNKEEFNQLISSYSSKIVGNKETKPPPTINKIIQRHQRESKNKASRIFMLYFSAFVLENVFQ